MAKWVWIDSGSLVRSLQVLMPLFSCWFHLYLSVLIQLGTMKQTHCSSDKDPSKTYFSSTLSPKSFCILCYVLSRHYNVQKWLCQPTSHIFCMSGGWLTHKSYLPLTLCIPLLPLPAESRTLICWLPWELLVMPLYSICHIVNDWWCLHLNYSKDLKQSPNKCFANHHVYH